MTRDEIDKASDRELDAMVAVELFGIKFHEHRGDPKCEVCGINKSYYKIISPPVHYSAGWPGLGLVVDEMRRQGWLVAMGTVRGRQGDTWWTEFSKGNIDYVSNSAGPDNAANCAKAALYALLAERESQ